MIVLAYFCWRDSGSFVFTSLSLTFVVADLCRCLNIGGLRAVGHNGGGGFPQARRCVGSLLHGGRPDGYLPTHQVIVAWLWWQWLEAICTKYQWLVALKKKEDEP
ncbi:hypothetical protein NDU88_004035 [Pleurodeles waltl]|uniref:Secreted protein n=1 Tax=Pleurodeles waltl TaxID=8319 RepID=A0AAV7NRD7_PLEWA|nr:hypothetical protein NDU88_004035 [Pleurodeles waltl]